MTKCLVFNSTADSGAGISNSGTLTLEDCGFRDNGVSYREGAIRNDNGTVVMDGCTFSSNYGGGSALFNSEGHAVLNDCEIKENGGDASIFTIGSYLQLDNCSIHDNYGACFGGSIMISPMCIKGATDLLMLLLLLSRSTLASACCSQNSAVIRQVSGEELRLMLKEGKLGKVQYPTGQQRRFPRDSRVFAE